MLPQTRPQKAVCNRELAEGHVAIICTHAAGKELKKGSLYVIRSNVLTTLTNQGKRKHRLYLRPYPTAIERKMDCIRCDSTWCGRLADAK